MHGSMKQDFRLPLCLFGLTALYTLWSFVNPYEYSTWFMEAAPVLIAAPLLFFTARKFPLTNLLYILIFVHAIILLTGAHYTYARVPFFEFPGEGRNNYDKIGHFAQGFIPAIAIRELLVRTSPIKPGKWLVAIIIFACLGISAIYEIIEFAAGAMLGSNATDFLGTQGDEWDTQKDMMWAGIGAIAALLCLSKMHNKALEKIGAYTRAAK